MEQLTFGEVTAQLIALYNAKKFDEAQQLVESHEAAFPEQAARMVFWRMCLLSLSNRPEDVLAVFRQGLERGLWWHTELFKDPDLQAVHDLPEFQQLLAVSRQQYDAASEQIPRDYAILQPELPPSGLYPLLLTLHGRNGNKDGDLGQWEVARQRGWLVISCQSTQPVFQGAYHWDDPARGLDDLRYYYEQASHRFPIDPARILLGGFSQGSGMAIYTALKGVLPARGFIGIGTWWADAEELSAHRPGLRGYFITGEQDHTLERAREIHEVLRKNNVPFEEEVYPDLGHEFSRDFATSFEKATAFIFQEHE